MIYERPCVKNDKASHIWKKIFASHIAEEGLTFGIHNELSNLIHTRRKHTIQFQRGRTHEGTLTRRDVVLNCVWLFVTSRTVACQAPLSFTICLPESAHIHIHWVGDAIQPFHPMSSLSPFALNLSQHQVLFRWVDSFFFFLHQVAKVLEFQHQSFQRIFRVYFL